MRDSLSLCLFSRFNSFLNLLIVSDFGQSLLNYLLSNQLATELKVLSASNLRNLLNLVLIEDSVHILGLLLLLLLGIDLLKKSL
jgi:hypothetical protein